MQERRRVFGLSEHTKTLLYISMQSCTVEPTPLYQHIYTHAGASNTYRGKKPDPQRHDWLCIQTHTDSGFNLRLSG